MENKLKTAERRLISVVKRESDPNESYTAFVSLKKHNPNATNPTFGWINLPNTTQVEAEIWVRNCGLKGWKIISDPNYVSQSKNIKTI